MMDMNLREWLLLEHYKDLLRESEKARFEAEALAEQGAERRWLGRMLNGLGTRMVAGGRWLQRRFAAERSIQSLPMVDRPQ